MCLPLNTVKLLRYLFVWRINSPLVRLPAYPAVSFSSVLGSMIAGRLPTRDANLWKKALGQTAEAERSTSSSPYARKGKGGPAGSWPIESVLFIYPGKVSYGKGEVVLWELKLFGESADHGFFLEVILPAMEEAGYTSDARWRRPDGLWGQFDIQDVYVARGSRWEPLVRDGRLDFRYRAHAGQWAEGLTLDPGADRTFNRMSWITPFDFTGEEAAACRSPDGMPSPGVILRALDDRLRLFTDNRYRKRKEVREALHIKGFPRLEEALEEADRLTLHVKDLKGVPAHWPGRWTGTLLFDTIPPPVIPFLQLASIFHVGNQTHFGCGTFSLWR